MSDSEGKPQDQNQPYKAPHSGQLPPEAGREVPAGREYDNTPLDEAHRLNLINTPSGTEDLGDLTEEDWEAIRAHREKRTKSGERSKFKKIVAGAIGGAVLLGGAGYGVSRALGGNGDHAADPNQPVATGPAVAGRTSAPTQAPTSQNTPEDPVSRASREAKQGHDKLTSDRDPFYKNPITSLSFNGILVDDATRELLVPGLTRSDSIPGTEIFPNSLEFTQLTTPPNFETILAKQQELSDAFNDGTLAKAIERSNQLYHTNYKLGDFYISKNEVPANATGANKQLASAFLANKIVHVTQMLDTIGAAMRHTGALDGSEPWAQPGPDGKLLPDGPLDSDKFTAMSHMFAQEQADAKATKDALGNLNNPEDYTPDTVVPSSARLVTNSGGTESYNGERLEQSHDGLNDVFTPLVGVVCDVNEMSVTSSIQLEKVQRLDYFILIPIKDEASGQIVDVPVSLGGKVLQVLG